MAAGKAQKRWWCTLCGEQKEGGERWTCDQRWSKIHQGEGGSCEYDICDPCMSRYTPVCERIQRLCLQLDGLQQQISSESQQQVLNLIRRQVEGGGSDLNSVELQLNLSETILNMLPGVNFDISENPLSSLDTPESLLLYLKDLVKYGKASSMAHGTVFVMGNTNAGKTSLVHTLREYIKAPSDKPLPWLSQDHEQFLETKILDIHSDIDLKPTKKVKVEVK